MILPSASSPDKSAAVLRIRIRISAEFNGIAWSRWGSAPCNQIIAKCFGVAGIKAFFDRFSVLGRPAAPICDCGALDHPAQRPPQLNAAFQASPSSPNCKTINSSRWRGLKRESEHRLEPMEGVDFFQKSLRSLRSRIQIIGSNRYAGPNRSTACVFVTGVSA